MIGYFDTSAVMPLVIDEPSSGRCAQVWRACDVRVSSMLVIAEAHAALAMALRLGRLSEPQHAAALDLLAKRIEELDLFLPTREVVDKAGELALAHALRGYDAVHAATALALKSDDLVAVTGDKTLLDAFTALGLATIEPGAPNPAAPESGSATRPAPPAPAETGQ